MTYRADPAGFPAAMRAAIAALGKAPLARHLGVSPSRLEQLANPARGDWRVLDLAAAADAAMTRAGQGAPFLAAYEDRLSRAGAPSPGAEAARARLRRAGLASLALLRRALALLEEALEPGAAPALARAGGAP